MPRSTGFQNVKGDLVTPTVRQALVVASIPANTRGQNSRILVAGTARGIEKTVAPIDVPDRENPPVRPSDGPLGWRRVRRAVVVLAQAAVGQIMAWMLRHWFG